MYIYAFSHYILHMCIYWKVQYIYYTTSTYIPSGAFLYIYIYNLQSTTTTIDQSFMLYILGPFTHLQICPAILLQVLVAKLVDENFFWPYTQDHIVPPDLPS